MKSPIIGASLAALLLAPPAFAQTATSFASIDNFGYQLVDLAPNDGIAPSVELWSGQHRAEAYLYGDPARNPLASARSLVYGSVDVAVAGSTAHSVLAPQQASSSVGALTATESEAFASDSINFVLSPHARLIFSGDAYVTVQQNLDSNVYASAKIFGEIPGNPLLSTRTLFNSTLEAALGENRQMLSVVVNSGDVETTGYVEFRTDAQAVSRVPPVPEPQQALLLCAGVGFLAAVRGRRRIPPTAFAKPLGETAFPLYSMLSFSTREWKFFPSNTVRSNVPFGKNRCFH